MKKFSLIVFFSFFFLTGFCQLKSSFKSIRLINGDSLDFSQQDGSFYLNQTTGQFRFRENGVWKGLGSGGGMSIDSARIYDSLSVLRDSVDDISNYVHGLSQDFWPLSGNFSTSGFQEIVGNNGGQLFVGLNAQYGFQTTGSGNIAQVYETTGPTFAWQIIDGNGIELRNGLSTGNITINNSGIRTDSSAVNKFYADTHLGGETFTPPTAGNDGQSVRWNDTGGEWEYYTPGGGGSFWPLSGNFSTTGAQTVTTGGNFILNDGVSDRFRITSGQSYISNAANDVYFRLQNTQTVFDRVDFDSLVFSYQTINPTATEIARIVVRSNEFKMGAGAAPGALANVRGARSISDDHFVTKAQLDSVAALITMDISPNSLELNKAVFDYKLLLLLCGVFIMGYYAHRNGYKRV